MVWPTARPHGQLVDNQIRTGGDSSTATSARRGTPERSSHLAELGRARCPLSARGRDRQRHRSTQAQPGGPFWPLRDDVRLGASPRPPEAGLQRRRRVGDGPHLSVPVDEVALLAALTAQSLERPSVTVGERPWARSTVIAIRARLGWRSTRPGGAARRGSWPGRLVRASTDRRVGFLLNCQRHRQPSEAGQRHPQPTASLPLSLIDTHILLPILWGGATRKGPRVGGPRP